MKNVLKIKQHFVVMATHPQTPNDTANMRGRKLHLAMNQGRHTKTLCNMLVTEPVMRNTNQSERLLCLNCSNLADRIIQKRFDETTYSITINTDASWSAKHGKVSSWACWIKSSHYKLTASGLFAEGVDNSSTAEVLALEQALMRLDYLINDEPFLQHHRDNGKILLYINTDSMFAVQAMNGNVKRSKHLEIVNRVRSLVDGYEVVARHVKGHTRGEDSRSWVNNWCDREARKLVVQRLGVLDGTRR